jgi:DNA-directed RNA polymerase specialized sigma24 family protein
VIFVEDVAKCLTQLDPGQRHLVRRISLEGYTQGETAAMLGIPMRTVVRRYADATDRLTRLFLERKLLKPKVDVRHDC